MLQQIKEAHTARKNQKGFTLIELLMVIVILGVLAGIVVFAVQGIQDRGEASACKAERSTVEVAQEAYYAKEGKYAGSVAALATAGFLHSGTARYATTDDTGVVTTAPADCSF